MANFEPVLLKNVGVKESHTLKVYKDRGGYKGLDAALAKSPVECVQSWSPGFSRCMVLPTT